METHTSRRRRPTQAKRHSRARHGGNSNSRGRRRGKRKTATFDPSQFINQNPVPQKQESYTPQHTFDDFGLQERITTLLHKREITVPSPIQDQTIPLTLKGHDVVGIAETGTGKTLAFLLPLIHKTLQNNHHQTLILAPTRELALQIRKELVTFTEGMRIFSVSCVGGMSIKPQLDKLRRRQNFIIGTPGRVIDLINRGKIRPSFFDAIVLDEADRMLDMGFIGDMRDILSKTKDEKQTLFFSATMTPAAEKLVHDFLKDPQTISVKKRDITSSIAQDVVTHSPYKKFMTLVDLLEEDDEFSRVIIFGETKRTVQSLCEDLQTHGIDAVSLHGDKNHRERRRALGTFTDGNARVMVATDVAARGIHIDDVSHVINYDLPQTFEDYVHRIGRTGRGKKQGKALTFVVAS